MPKYSIATKSFNEEATRLSEWLMKLQEFKTTTTIELQELKDNDTKFHEKVE